jgi:hypothetical protein
MSELSEVISMTDSFFDEASSGDPLSLRSQKLKEIKMQLKRNPELNSKNLFGTLAEFN